MCQFGEGGGVAEDDKYVYAICVLLRHNRISPELARRYYNAVIYLPFNPFTYRRLYSKGLSIMRFFKVIGNASTPYVTNTFLVYIYIKKKKIYRIIDQLARVKYAWCYAQKRLRATCMYFVKRNKKRSPRCFIFNTSTYLYVVSLYTTLYYKPGFHIIIYLTEYYREHYTIMVFFFFRFYIVVSSISLCCT